MVEEDQSERTNSALFFKLFENNMPNTNPEAVMEDEESQYLEPNLTPFL